MQSDGEYIHIEFHNKARDVYFSLIKDFQFSSATIDRSTEEYLYRPLREKYVSTLKQKLELIAGDILKTNQAQEKIPEINQSFHRFINDYLHQFVQKLREM
jgi:hypothetical protein